MATSSVTVLGQGIPREGMRLIKLADAKSIELHLEGIDGGGYDGIPAIRADLEKAATVGIDEIEVDTYMAVQRFLEDLQGQGGKSATTLSAYAHGASTSSTPPLDIPLPHSAGPETIRSAPESIASDVVDPTQPPDILPSDALNFTPPLEIVPAGNTMTPHTESDTVDANTT
ncbi:hypothetical protein K7X08_000898 [Anisodus acutangulus]|uniref:Uncharacterized protein n=1 Tax=Anisodus acutangulus TaxID=402998 RepID=A0A9Q1MNB0_9SOLA|nr:hypothetical protein K7X08_000898 [Anisodus acutangulus]